MSRETRTSRDVTAGCHDCDGYATYAVKWEGKNAQGVAARHHDATGHTTWVHVDMSISYGPRVSPPAPPKRSEP